MSGRIVRRLLPALALAAGVIAFGGATVAAGSTAAECCTVTYNKQRTKVMVTGTVHYKGTPLLFSLDGRSPCASPGSRPGTASIRIGGSRCATSLPAITRSGSFTGQRQARDDEVAALLHQGNRPAAEAIRVDHFRVRAASSRERVRCSSSRSRTHRRAGAASTQGPGSMQVLGAVQGPRTRAPRVSRARDRLRR